VLKERRITYKSRSPHGNRQFFGEVVRRNRQKRRGIGRAKTAQPMELPFGMVSGVCPRNRVLDGRAR